MTLSALLLLEGVFKQKISTRFRYAALGLLFVNVSIGGTLTHFAAPPVVMVARVWNWDTAHMLSTYGWRAIPSVVIGTLLTAFVFRKELAAIPVQTRAKGAAASESERPSPIWLTVSHAAFIVLVIMNSHYSAVVVPTFLLFLGWWTVTKEHQDELKLRESLLVGFFLGGLVTLGNLQDWWLQPLLAQLGPRALFAGATALTAVTDNAALTYLGTLVPELSEVARYALVAGAVTGGGLTVIANAPNPVGFGMLQDTFGEDGISPLNLLLGALPYTILAAIFFFVGAL